MKKLALLIFCFMASVIANAQYKVTSVDKLCTKNSTPLQVLETENRVLVYCTFTTPTDENLLYYLPRKIKAVKNNVGYKVLNSVNFPLWDEAEPRYLATTKKGQKFNFVLEFEKFDPAGGFDIIDEETAPDNNPLTFNGIHLEEIDPKELIDAKRFLDDGHVIYGYYKADNHTYRYYIKEGLMVLFYNTWYGKDFIINLEITNNSDHGVMFDLSNLRYEGTDAKGKPVKIVRYTPESYDARIESDRHWDASQQVGGDVARMGESLIFHERINTNNEWGKLGMLALESIYKRAQENRIQEYLQKHPNTDPKALRSNSIKPGESIIGFVPFQIKKAQKVKIHLPMDGYDFVINYNINK